MPKVVFVHGIGNQLRGEETAGGKRAAAVRDGLRRVGEAGRAVAESLRDGDVVEAFYGRLFRPPGRHLGPGDPWLTPEDATDYEAELLRAWWQGASEVEPAVITPDARTLVGTPKGVQATLRGLSQSRFFAGLAERLLIFDAVQVRRYFTEPAIRDAARQSVADAVREDTRVVIGHSLGSVVAYEALCDHPEWPIHTFVSLGSPLGVRNLVFDRLEPPPGDGRPTDEPVGSWPGGVGAWVNIADAGDVVALVKDLRPRFGERVDGYLVRNGATVHAAESYLTTSETGAAVLAALAPA